MTTQQRQAARRELVRQIEQGASAREAGVSMSCMVSMHRTTVYRLSKGVQREYDLRGALEVLAVRLAAPRLSQEDLSLSLLRSQHTMFQMQHTYYPKRMYIALNEHEQILLAMLAGNIDEAADCLTRHKSPCQPDGSKIC